MKVFYIATVILLLLFVLLSVYRSVAKAKASGPPQATENDLFQMVEALMQHRPFRLESVTRITGCALHPDARHSNPFFTMYNSGSHSKGCIANIDLRVPTPKALKKDGLVVLSLNPETHIIPDAVRRHFGVDHEIRPSDPNNPHTAYTYIYRKPWGCLNFGFSRTDDYLVVISLDATESMTDR